MWFSTDYEPKTTFDDIFIIWRARRQKRRKYLTDDEADCVLKTGKRLFANWGEKSKECADYALMSRLADVARQLELEQIDTDDARKLTQALFDVYTKQMYFDGKQKTINKDAAEKWRRK